MMESILCWLENVKNEINNSESLTVENKKDIEREVDNLRSFLRKDINLHYLHKLEACIGKCFKREKDEKTIYMKVINLDGMDMAGNVNGQFIVYKFTLFHKDLNEKEFLNFYASPYFERYGNDRIDGVAHENIYLIYNAANGYKIEPLIKYTPDYLELITDEEYEKALNQYMEWFKKNIENIGKPIDIV